MARGQATGSSCHHAEVSTMKIRPRRFVFVNANGLIVYETQVDSKGNFDMEKMVLNMLLQGFRTTEHFGSLRVLVEPASAEFRNKMRLGASDVLEHIIHTRPGLIVGELTPRQREVGAMIGLGMANKEIGHRLNITERTVKFHVSALLHLFSVKGRHELANAMSPYNTLKGENHEENHRPVVSVDAVPRQHSYALVGAAER
jgi:DNA-binding CsgD family transcriptional regulator